MPVGRSRSRVALLAFGFAIGAHAAHADLGTNLVSNPSFEDATGDLPTGWLITQESQPDPVAIPGSGTKLVRRFEMDLVGEQTVREPSEKIRYLGRESISHATMIALSSLG